MLGFPIKQQAKRWDSPMYCCAGFEKVDGMNFPFALLQFTIRLHGFP